MPDLSSAIAEAGKDVSEIAGRVRDLVGTVEPTCRGRDNEVVKPSAPDQLCRRLAQTLSKAIA